MVNKPPTTIEGDRRARPRDGASPAAVLGGANLNPFGDLHTLQHLSARLARSLRGVFEPLLRHELRTWAEPLAVKRLGGEKSGGGGGGGRGRGGAAGGGGRGGGGGGAGGAGAAGGGPRPRPAPPPGAPRPPRTAER